MASANAAVGMAAGAAVLAGGGTALDAVEAVARLAEADPDDHTVGVGGWPNLLGVVELDASIMDGTTRRAGAVGALRGFRHPISVARAVMERLPHVLLVGDGAARFAREVGAEEGELLTPAARKGWQARVALAGVGDVLVEPGADPGVALAGAVGRALDPSLGMGTVDVLAIDRSGAMASAVSTSGWSWKYPGRVGDSPVPGAGNYCDGRWGAAACTGFGELALRSGAARLAVSALARGAAPAEAAAEALADVADLAIGAHSYKLRVVVLAADGRHAALTNDPAGGSYVHWCEGMGGHEALARTVYAPRP